MTRSREGVNPNPLSAIEQHESTGSRPHRIKIHLPGYSLGLRRSELEHVPPAQTPHIERELTDGVAVYATDSPRLEISDKEKAAEMRTPRFEVRQDGTVRRRPDRNTAFEEQIGWERRATIRQGGIQTGRRLKLEAEKARRITDSDREEEEDAPRPTPTSLAHDVLESWRTFKARVTSVVMRNVSPNRTRREKIAEGREYKIKNFGRR